MMKRAFIAALLSLVAAQFAPAAPVSGDALYQKRCAACHDSAAERVPPRDALKKMSVARILRALDFGAMINIAGPMTREEREAVATFLGVAGGIRHWRQRMFVPIAT